MNLGQLDVRDVSLQLGFGSDRFTTLENVSFHVPPGEFVCLLGPSGCGKSTLLGALAGHLSPSQGSLRLDGQLITAPHPERGLVFQQHTLFPWQSVIDNVGFGLKMRGIGRRERRQRAQELLAQMGLADFAQRYPHELSGGMQQRVEIARVLINRPRLLLMDEPFGALDALSRLHMQELLLRVWAQVQTTVIFVTHDIDEALFLADRILIMSPRPGRIIEEIDVHFSRPRHLQLSTSSEFTRLKRHCLNRLRPDQADEPLSRLTPLGEPGFEQLQLAV